MLKINKDYSDYTDETDSNYPEGKAINASTAESVDGTPLLASFMNNIIGALQGMYKRAFGNTSGIDGKADSVTKSQFVEAVEKFTDDKIIEHEVKRGLTDGIHGATAEAVGGQLVTRDEFGSAEFSTPLTNAAAARRGDIYDLTRAVVCGTEETNFAKEIENQKLPGFVLQNEAQIKVLFQFGAIKAVEDVTDADVLTLNCCGTGAKKIFAKKDGVIIPLGSHDIDGKRSYFQSYTDLSLIYLEALDEGNGGWLILGNPVVLSKSSDTEGYTVYADGLIKQYKKSFTKPVYWSAGIHNIIINYDVKMKSVTETNCDLVVTSQVYGNGTIISKVISNSSLLNETNVIEYGYVLSTEGSYYRGFVASCWGF